MGKQLNYGWLRWLAEIDLNKLKSMKDIYEVFK